MDQREVWEAVAQPWHRFRRHAPHEVTRFLAGKNRVLDLGCGSGRNFVEGKNYVGVDFSENMLEYAKQHAEKNKINAVFVKADVTMLPLKPGKFDTVLLVAVLHATRKHGEMLQEMKRVMRKGGHALITVWNKNQPRFFFSEKETLVPWRSRNGEYKRYYYLFTGKELKKVLSKYFAVERIWGGRNKALKLFPENIIAIARKE